MSNRLIDEQSARRVRGVLLGALIGASFWVAVVAAYFVSR